MNAYLDCQELDDHCKHTKHQGNQKNEDPNDVSIRIIQTHSGNISAYFAFYQFVNDIIYFSFPIR